AERDVGPLVTVGLLYSYRLQTFSGFKSTDPQPIDWQGHVGELNVKATPTEWLSLRARGGFKAITFKNKVDKTRAIGDLAAAVGDESAHADLSASTDVSQDFLGNPATVTQARLGFAYQPTAPWEASVGGTYGQLEYNLGVPATSTTVKTDQGYFEGDAGVAYHIRVGVIRLGALHHESTTKIDTVAGSAKIVSNRGYLSIGGQF
ncbi:MAG TPA: hypothetical protein VMV18_02035, partial [bacterium]|nr:hypothetical protein [bacterium]